MRGAMRGARDLTSQQLSWFDHAKRDDACVYFAVERDGDAIGQVMLHDAEWDAHRALVGYHIFRAADRGRGYGTDALRLLCAYAGAVGLRDLVMITGVENIASRRIAEKCGFRERGSAREGPHLVAYARGAGDHSRAQPAFPMA
jgi:RimJ/RimL family protein N-acetyltransferase